ncbi:PilZ domain-containing protein [Allosphingosinicella sp.]|uniref:PilZ domain-containing protein n=1 Tax=Allosphingosinicella sp. TaxID=2823234 RepID=UPI003D7508DF
MALHDPKVESRRAPRFACDLSASVRDRGRPRSPARVLDISTDGCRIEALATFTSGSWIWLSLPGLETQYARVAWCHDEFAGLEFAASLNVAVVRQLVSGMNHPSEKRVAQLQELSVRCRQLSERLSGHDNAARLLSLARDCETRAVVEGLRTRFG